MAEERKQPSAEKLKALQLALDKIDKDFGKGAIMKLGDDKITSEHVFLAILSDNREDNKIKKVFETTLDSSIAEKYYIKGTRGEAKKIALPRELVVWE